MNVDDRNKDQLPKPLPDLNVAQRVYLLSVLLQKAQYKLRTPDVYEESSSIVRNTGLGSSGKVLNHIALLLSRGTKADLDLIVAASVAPLRADRSHAFITYHRRLSPSNSPPSSRDITPSSSTAAAEFLSADRDQVASEQSQNIATGQDRPQQRDMVLGKNSNIPSSSQFILDGTIPTERIEAILAMIPSEVNFPDYVESAFQVARALAQKKLPLRTGEIYIMRHCHSEVEKRLSYVEKIYLQDKHLLLWSPEPDEHVAEETIDLSPLKSQVLFKSIDHVGDSYRFNILNAPQWLECVLVIMEAFRIEMNALKEEDEASLVHVCRMSSLLHTLLKILPSSLWKIHSLVRLLDKLRKDFKTDRTDIIGDVDAHQKDSDTMDDFLDDSESVPSSVPNGSILFIRSLDATTSWTTAIRFLSKQHFLKSSIPIHCLLVDLPNETPTSIKWNEYKSPSDRWFGHGLLHPKKKQLTSQLNRIVEDGSASGFHGSCHCESGMMASMVASITEGSLNPMPAEVLATFLPFGEEYRLNSANDDEVREERFMDIGVAKKSCAICYMTADAVNRWLKKEGHQLQFRLPGTHSLYYPWMPPTWLPAEVLRNLETAMLHRLTGMVTACEMVGEAHTDSPNETDDEKGGSSPDMLPSEASLLKARKKVWM